MLDYEVKAYTVYYELDGAVVSFSRCFYTEETAVAFIRENKDNWTDYRLEQTRVAVGEI